MRQENEPHLLPVGKAILWILLSVVVVSGGGTLFWYYNYAVRKARRHDDTYQITAIVQTGPKKEALKTECLAELLNLSADMPTNLYQFSTEKARRRLVAAPQIKEAKVQRIHPSTLYIEYTVREPAAVFADYSNTLVDAEGVLFPSEPFFQDEKLPKLYLGIEANWGEKLQGKRAELAFQLLKLLKENFKVAPAHIRWIDVSQVDAPSYGQREIVIILEECCEKTVLYHHTLRLGTDNYREALSNYLVLRDHLFEKKSSLSEPVSEAESLVIDLRIPDLAFFKKQKLKGVR